MDANARRPVRVVVVDDHPLIRDVVKFACSARDDVRVVGEAADGPAALEVCERVRPDVVLLDLGLPGIDGLEVMRRLREAARGERVLVLSGRDDPEAVLEAIRAGASGFLEKTASLDRVVGAIAAVAAGADAFPDDVRRRASDHLADVADRARRGAAAASTLTRRERQVLDLVAEGLTSRQIAVRLGVSERTVETHVGSLYGKLGVRTRVQAVTRAAALGLT